MELSEEIRKRAARVRDGQLNVLINYMVDDRDFACGRFQGPQGKVTAERQWQQLAEILARHGPNKTIAHWKKVWKDLKCKARSKNAKINADRERTGNITVDQERLTDIEQKVLGIIGINTSIPLFDGSVRNDEVSDDTAISLNVEIEEPIVEVVVGESCIGNPESFSTKNGAVTETIIPPRGSCQPKKSSLHKELEAVTEKVETYEGKHLQLLEDIKESIISLNNQHSLLVDETKSISNSMKELSATNARIAAALEMLTSSSSGQL